MVNVYVWSAHITVASPGHAALEVQSNKHSIYMSWYPVEFSLSKPAILFGGAVQSSPHISLQEDVRYSKSDPNHQTSVHGLNESAIIDFWRVWLQHNRYRLYNQSCATTVADALRAGGGDTYAPQFSKRHLWWPDEVYKYALAINYAQRA